MVFSGLRRGLLPVRVCYYGKYACHFGRSCRVSDAFRGDCGEKVRIIPADCRGSSWLCHGNGLVHSVRRLLSECRRNDGRKNGKRSHPGVGLQLRDGIRYRRGRHGAAGRKVLPPSGVSGLGQNAGTRGHRLRPVPLSRHHAEGEQNLSRGQRHFPAGVSGGRGFRFAPYRRVLAGYPCAAAAPDSGNFADLHSAGCRALCPGAFAGRYHKPELCGRYQPENQRDSPCGGCFRTACVDSVRFAYCRYFPEAVSDCPCGFSNAAAFCGGGGLYPVGQPFVHHVRTDAGGAAAE